VRWGDVEAVTRLGVATVLHDGGAPVNSGGRR
jgi:hypothetical protein